MAAVVATLIVIHRKDTKLVLLVEAAARTTDRTDFMVCQGYAVASEWNECANKFLETSQPKFGGKGVYTLY